MNALLIRLYPARWRARYGDEFEALLEERPLGPFDVADILLAAIDAHIHLRRLGAASHSQRSFAMSLRLGGSAAILGGLLLLGGMVAASGVFGSNDPFPGAAMILAGTAALLVALIGLSAFQARRHPRLIWAAFAIPAVGAAVACVGLVAMGVVGDRPFVAGLSPWSIWMLGLLATIVGSVLFALATYHTRAISRPAASLLAVGSGLMLALFVVGMSGVLGFDTVPPAFIFVGLLAFSAGWIALGWAAVRLDRPATEPRPA
jgi:hypothetical protein